VLLQLCFFLTRRSLLIYHVGGLNSNRFYNEGDTTPRPSSPSFTPLDNSHPENPATQSTTTGKSVQFADSTQQSHSDSELERPPLSKRQPTGYASSADRDGQRRRKSGKRNSSPASVDSSEVIEMPRRFDESGRKLFTDQRHDSVGDAVEAFLTGRTKAGASFNKTVDGWLGIDNDNRSNGRRDGDRKKERDRVGDRDRRRRYDYDG